MSLNIDNVKSQLETCVEQVIVKHNKTMNDAVLGEIQTIAGEYGIVTEILLNDKAIIQALKNATPQKMIRINYQLCCPTCVNQFDTAEIPNYCDKCGQKLDLGETEKGGVE